MTVAGRSRSPTASSCCCSELMRHARTLGVEGAAAVVGLGLPLRSRVERGRRLRPAPPREARSDAITHDPWGGVPVRCRPDATRMAATGSAGSTSPGCCSRWPTSPRCSSSRRGRRVPFHFIWVSLTVLYGFRVWRTRPTLDGARRRDGDDRCVHRDRLLPRSSAARRDHRGAARWPRCSWRWCGTPDAGCPPWRRPSACPWRTCGSSSVSVGSCRMRPHELRTPITVALGHTELIQRRATDPTHRRGRGRDRGRAGAPAAPRRRSAPARGTEDPSSSTSVPVDVAEIVVDAFRRWAATPRRWVLGAAEEAIVLADRDRLAVAFDALIENAVQHTREQDTIEVARPSTAAARRSSRSATRGRGSRMKTSIASSTVSPGRIPAAAGTPAGSDWGCRSFERSSRLTSARSTSMSRVDVGTTFEIDSSARGERRPAHRPANVADRPPSRVTVEGG